MAGWAEEADAAVALASRAASNLQAIDPRNELLWFFVNPPEGVSDPFGGDEERSRIAMKDRFWQREEPWRTQPGAIVTTIVATNYFLALRDEIQRLTVNKEREI